MGFVRSFIHSFITFNGLERVDNFVLLLCVLHVSDLFVNTINMRCTTFVVYTMERTLLYITVTDIHQNKNTKTNDNLSLIKPLEIRTIFQMLTIKNDDPYVCSQLKRVRVQLC